MTPFVPLSEEELAENEAMCGEDGYFEVPNRDMVPVWAEMRAGRALREAVKEALNDRYSPLCTCSDSMMDPENGGPEHGKDCSWVKFSLILDSYPPPTKKEEA